VPRLNQRAGKALAHVRLIVSDASSVTQLAQRALDAIEPAVPFDLGAVWAVDSESLLLTGVLALRGHTRPELDDWVRDIYLVAGEPPSMQFPALLRGGGGVGAYHSDPGRWLRISPEPDTAAGLAAAWRATHTPAGGFLRYGLAHRRRWVGALQLARLDAGTGFRSSELEFLDRAAPALGRALAERLTPASSPPLKSPVGGRVIFDDQRRVVSVSEAGLEWLSRLDDVNDRTDPRIAVPVAAQSLVSHLAASGSSEARIAITDIDGRPVTIHGERLLQARTTQSAEPVLGYCLTISSAPLLGVDSTAALTNGQWRVARAVAHGLTDRQIAVQLGLATATVHERVQSLHNLLDTHSRAELVATLHLARYRP
jgi:DNA-binding CsgD family transcriptional regulator